MKTVSIVGARPQFVKAAVVSRALRALPGVEELLVHTGQHYDAQMSQIFFSEMDIPSPDYNLGIGSGLHGEQTGRMIEELEKVLLDARPDCVLVYGDTNSTLAGALAAAKLHVPVAHVEAGLRSRNRRMPEEINRVLTDHVSDVLFTPTSLAAANLRGEGMAESQICEVGDVMYDAALQYGAHADRCSKILNSLKIAPFSYVLATVHRAENTDDLRRLSVIIETLERVSELFPVVFPVHPRTRKVLENSCAQEILARLKLIDPVGYLDMMMLEKNARLVMTDSGGVQKEAFFSRVPCVTMREETEWRELIELGWNRLAPPTTVEQQFSQVCIALNSNPVSDTQPYGAGNAALKIASALVERYATTCDERGSVLAL